MLTKGGPTSPALQRTFTSGILRALPIRQPLAVLARRVIWGSGVWPLILAAVREKPPQGRTTSVCWESLPRYLLPSIQRDPGRSCQEPPPSACHKELGAWVAGETHTLGNSPTVAPLCKRHRPGRLPRKAATSGSTIGNVTHPTAGEGAGERRCGPFAGTWKTLCQVSQGCRDSWAPRA